MLKKLLSLSLAAVLLSTVAFASGGAEMIMDAAYAEVAEEVTVPFDFTKYEILRVTQPTETTQTITKPTSNVSGSTTSSWYLVKVDIGKDWGSFTSITSKFRMLAAKGLNYRYITSLTKADYDVAAAAVGTTVDNFLSEPSVVAAGTEYMWKDGSNFGSNTSKQNKTFTLSEGQYTYSDGCLYFAIQFTSTHSSYPYVGLRVAETSYFETTVTGTKVAVTDFSDATITWTAATGEYTVTTATASGTAMLVIASFNDTTMVDAKVATINAEDANADDVISGTIADLEEGTSYKAFLWAKNTLVPAINAVEF